MHISNLEISKNHHNIVWFSLQGDCSQCSNQAINQVRILYKSHNYSSLLQLWKKILFQATFYVLARLRPVMNWHNSYFHLYIQCDSKEFQMKWLKKNIKLAWHLNVTFLPVFLRTVIWFFVILNPTLASSFNELNFLIRFGATQNKNVCMYKPGWSLCTVC